MAEYEEEQKSRGEQAAEEGARLGGRRFAEKAGPGAARGAAASGAGTTAGAAGTTGGVAAGGTAAGGAAAAGGTAGTAAAPGVGTAVGAAAGAAAATAVSKAKYIIPAAIGLVIAIPTAAFLLIITVPLVLIMILFGMVDMGEAVQDFIVEKEASPERLDNGTKDGDAADVLYTITLTNKLDGDITSITLTDDECPIPDPDDKIAVLPAGAETERSYICSVRTWPDVNIRHKNTVTARGSYQYEDADGKPVSETVSDTAYAYVAIGDPPLTDPVGWPVGDGLNTWVSQTPYCINMPSGCVSHKNSSAVDIAAPTNYPVYATHDGTAFWNDETETAYKGGLGIYVAIDGDTYRTYYGHLKKVNPDCPFAGGGSRRITAGSLIGYVDNTGWSEGPHLHYHIKYNPKNGGGQVEKEELDEVFPPGYDEIGKFITASYSKDSCE